MARVSNWWRKTLVEPLPPTAAEDPLRRVAEINAGRAIQIEEVITPDLRTDRTASRLRSVVSTRGS